MPKTTNQPEKRPAQEDTSAPQTTVVPTNKRIRLAHPTVNEAHYFDRNDIADLADVEIFRDHVARPVATNVQTIIKEHGTVNLAEENGEVKQHSSVNLSHLLLTTRVNTRFRETNYLPFPINIAAMPPDGRSGLASDGFEIERYLFVQNTKEAGLENANSSNWRSHVAGYGTPDKRTYRPPEIKAFTRPAMPRPNYPPDRNSAFDRAQALFEDLEHQTLMRHINVHMLGPTGTPVMQGLSATRAVLFGRRDPVKAVSSCTTADWFHPKVILGFYKSTRYEERIFSKNYEQMADGMDQFDTQYVLQENYRFPGMLKDRQRNMLKNMNLPDLGVPNPRCASAVDRTSATGNPATGGYTAHRGSHSRGYYITRAHLVGLLHGSTPTGGMPTTLGDVVGLVDIVMEYLDMTPFLLTHCRSSRLPVLLEHMFPLRPVTTRTTRSYINSSKEMHLESTDFIVGRHASDDEEKFPGRTEYILPLFELRHESEVKLGICPENAEIEASIDTTSTVINNRIATLCGRNDTPHTFNKRKKIEKSEDDPLSEYFQDPPESEQYRRVHVNVPVFRHMGNVVAISSISHHLDGSCGCYAAARPQDAPDHLRDPELNPPAPRFDDPPSPRLDDYIMTGIPPSVQAARTEGTYRYDCDLPGRQHGCAMCGVILLRASAYPVLRNVMALLALPNLDIEPFRQDVDEKQQCVTCSDRCMDKLVNYLIEWRNRTDPSAGAYLSTYLSPPWETEYLSEHDEAFLRRNCGYRAGVDPNTLAHPQ